MAGAGAAFHAEDVNCSAASTQQWISRQAGRPLRLRRRPSPGAGRGRSVPESYRPGEGVRRTTRPRRYVHVADDEHGEHPFSRAAYLPHPGKPGRSEIWVGNHSNARVGRDGRRGTGESGQLGGCAHSPGSTGLVGMAGGFVRSGPCANLMGRPGRIGSISGDGGMLQNISQKSTNRAARPANHPAKSKRSHRPNLVSESPSPRRGVLLNVARNSRRRPRRRASVETGKSLHRL